MEGWLSDQELVRAHLEEDAPDQALNVHFLRGWEGAKGGEVGGMNEQGDDEHGASKEHQQPVGWLCQVSMSVRYVQHQQQQ